MAKSIAELSAICDALADRVDTARQEITERTIAGLRQENAILRQRLDDHLKRIETWSGRLWALVVVLVGAVMSLASGLIVALAKKGTP